MRFGGQLGKVRADYAKRQLLHRRSAGGRQKHSGTETFGAFAGAYGFREGDYSPVELAWCTYTTEAQYQNVLEQYPSLAEEIRAKTVTEGQHRIICYTQILTDVPDFHRNLEKLEIYNGNLDRESFEAVVLERFGRWNGEGQIFECSIFRILLRTRSCTLA